MERKQISPLISVIMPVYNVDRFVGRAISSIQNQTLPEFEFLIVDDGSTDQTGSICDRAAERDYRIEVFHIPNGGAAAARNYALDRARGTYIYFMDGDDWAEPNMLEDFVNAMSRGNLELLISGFYIETYYSDEHYTSELKNCPSRDYGSQEAFRADAFELFDQNLLYVPWNKLFLRSRIEELNLRFRPTFMDDFPFVLDYIRDVERVGVTEKAYYHFIRARAESETAKWRPNLYEKREEEHDWMLDLYNHWNLMSDADSMEMVQRRYIERLVGCIENLCSPECTLSNKEKLDQVQAMISNERAQEALSVAKPRSRMMSLMLIPISRQDARLALQEGRFISFVRRHSTKLFATLKARR